MHHAYCPACVNLVRTTLYLLMMKNMCILFDSYRKLVPSFDQAPCFGLDLILNRQGTIRVGDAIYAVTGQPRLAP